MRRFALGGVAALLATAFAALPGFGGAGPVLAHAQLVTSLPGTGEVVPAAPAELVLVFSEPPELPFSEVHLADESGGEVAHNGLTVDPADEHRLLVALPTLADGTYGVTWSVVSSADGHATVGFFSFGVGDAALAPVVEHDEHAHGGAGASVFAGRDPATIATWILAKGLGYAGPLLAIGFAAFGLLVSFPATRRLPAGLVMAVGTVLVLGGAASLAQIWLQVDSIRGMTGVGVVEFAQGSRIGQLLLARAIVGAGSGAVIVVAALLMARSESPRGQLIALGVGAVNGLVVTGLITAGGHASAFAAPGPVVSHTVHLASGGAWIGGLVVLAALAIGAWRRGEPLRSGDLVPLVSRFSALALVAIGLVGLTGLYASWIHAGWLFALDDAYRFALAAKLVLVAIALGLGGLNYLDGARRPERWGGFGRRISLEAALAIGILALTANLSVRAPSTQAAPIAIAPAVSAAGTESGTTLAISPGRAGPNRFDVTLATAVPPHVDVELVLQRLDRDTGVSRIPLHPATAVTDHAAGTRDWIVDGGLLSTDSAWDATVVVHAEDGSEESRQRFAFAVDADGISQGRAEPPVNPALLVAAALVLLGVLGVAYGAAGGSPPLREARAGRLALVGGGALSVASGVLMFVGLPPLTG